MSGDPTRVNVGHKYCMTWDNRRWTPWFRDTGNMWWRSIGPVQGCRTRTEALLRIEWDEFAHE